MRSKEISGALRDRLASSPGALAKTGLLLLMVQDENELHRFTLRLEAEKVQVEEGTQFPSGGESWAVIETSLADWESFVVQPQGEARGHFKFYGDADVLCALGQRLNPSAPLRSMEWR